MSGGAKRTVVMRKVVNRLIYVLSTGCQWRAITKDLTPRVKWTPELGPGIAEVKV